MKVDRPADLLRLSISYPGRTMTFPLHATSKTSFYVRSFDGEVTFRTDGDGRAESATFRIGGEDRPLRLE